MFGSEDRPVLRHDPTRSIPVKIYEIILHELAVKIHCCACTSPFTSLENLENLYGERLSCPNYCLMQVSLWYLAMSPILYLNIMLKRETTLSYKQGIYQQSPPLSQQSHSKSFPHTKQFPNFFQLPVLWLQTQCYQIISSSRKSRGIPPATSFPSNTNLSGQVPVLISSPSTCRSS